MRSSFRAIVLGLLLCGFCCGICHIARAQVSASIQVVDQTGSLAAIRPGLEDCVRAAMLEWGKVLRTPTGAVNVRIRVTATEALPRTTARSGTSTFVASRNGYHVFESSLVAKLRTGAETNGFNQDVDLWLNPVYALGTLWYDPQPLVRTALVPIDRIDAISVFTHALAHAIAFYGWRDHSTGELLGVYQSPFDELVAMNAPETGRALRSVSAQALYAGNDLPLTNANIYHIGNAPSREQPDALDDLMHDLDFERGRRYPISRIDLAICRDVNVPVRLGCNRADIAGLGGPIEPDGRLTIDDVVAFAAAYFRNDVATADLVGVGANAAADGQLTPDDLIAFFSAFFRGCP